MQGIEGISPPELIKDLHYRYHDRLLNSVTAAVGDRASAEDITATAFAAALKYFGSFRGKSSFYTWVHAIALNETRTHWRQKRTVSLESLDDHLPKALIEQDVLADVLSRSECYAKIRKVLRQIPTIYRRTLIDHFVHGLRVKQIAKSHRVPVGTVLSRIFTGKRILRMAWERSQVVQI